MVLAQSYDTLYMLHASLTVETHGTGDSPRLDAADKCLKVFIDPVTRAKIVMIKGKDSVVKAEMLKYFAPDQYPKILPGGTSDYDFADKATRKAYFDEERARVAAAG